MRRCEVISAPVACRILGLMRNEPEVSKQTARQALDAILNESKLKL
jgi:hypothetical protein